MPVDGLAGLAAAAGAANIGSFVFDAWDAIEKRKKDKKSSGINGLLEVTGTNLELARTDVAAHKDILDLGVMNEFLKGLDKCTVDHNTNIDWQRQAQVGKLARSRRKEYEQGVKTNKDLSHNLVLKAQVNSQLAKNKILIVETRAALDRERNRELLSANIAPQCSTAAHPQADETRQVNLSIEHSEGSALGKDPFADSQTPQDPATAVLEIELRSITLSPEGPS